MCIYTACVLSAVFGVGHQPVICLEGSEVGTKGERKRAVWSFFVWLVFQSGTEVLYQVRTCLVDFYGTS